MKTCPGCKQTKPQTEYHKNKNRRDGLNHTCKICACERVAKSKKNHPERMARVAAERTFKLHHIEREDWQRMNEAQGGNCAICKGPPIYNDRTKGRLYIDHDHACCPGSYSCGKCIRGLICTRCNVALGMVKDSIEILRSLITYLDQSTDDNNVGSKEVA